MRFKEFLMKEDGVSARHLSAAKMSLDEMVEWVEENASYFMANDGEIYRGIDSHNAEGLYNGTQMNRSAANTHNYGNLWMSNHHDWSNFPNRSKSFICTTNPEYTEGFGTQYMVIPSDSSMIGICPTEDMWDAFPDIRKLTNGMGFSEFMDLIEYLIQEKTGSNQNYAKDWDRMAGVLNSVDIDDVKKAAEEKNGNAGMAMRLLSYMQYKQIETLYEVFEQLFNPKKAGFSIEPAATFPELDGREVWMSGSVLIVLPHTYRQIKDALR